MTYRELLFGAKQQSSKCELTLKQLPEISK